MLLLKKIKKKIINITRSHYPLFDFKTPPVSLICEPPFLRYETRDIFTRLIAAALLYYDITSFQIRARSTAKDGFSIRCILFISQPIALIFVGIITRRRDNRNTKNERYWSSDGKVIAVLKTENFPVNTCCCR